VRGLSELLYLYKRWKTRGNSSCTPLSEGFRVQINPQRPEYPAGSAVYITSSGEDVDCPCTGSVKPQANVALCITCNQRLFEGGGILSTTPPMTQYESKEERLKKKYFIRPFKDTARWHNVIHQPASEDSNLIGQLYADCFTHHHDFRFAPNDQDAFHIQDDPRRLIRKNNLTTYFQKRFLEGKHPEYVPTPIFESPNHVDDESELGQPCSFDFFYQAATAIPFDPSNNLNITLGENRVTFLIGGVGIGKTFTLSQLAQRIAEEKRDSSDFQVLPVYVCLESFVSSHGNSNDSPELVRRLLAHILSVTQTIVDHWNSQAALQARIEQPPRDATSEQFASAIARFAKNLARVATTPVRLVLILDNLDVLHYQNSRYVFFPHEYTKHRRFIEDKIIKIIFAFIDPTLLGDAGLCVCIAARHNVARESRLINQPALPRRIELNDHLVFQLGHIDPIQVVKSRLSLLEGALTAYSRAKEQRSGALDFAEQLGLLKTETGRSIAPENLSDGLRRVSNLAHHGARSLVDFLNKLKINILKQPDVVQRLFGHSPWLLERLYIADLHQRFSQSQGHFPNVFLVDGTVNEKVITNVVHRHTYWLKYLLLRRVGSAKLDGISIQDLLDEFCGDFNYEPDIVRLSLGSLAMVNESRCIEIIGAAQDECEDNIVRLTNRGRVLIGEHRSYRFPYCFELSYLQMVVDDHLLSLPREIAQKIAVDTSLNYALTEGERYFARMRHDLSLKLPAALTFARVLEASWTEECIVRPKLAAAAKSIGPSFQEIYATLEETIKKVSVQATQSPAPIIELLVALRANDSFDSFFRAYSDEFDQSN
jgi:hypothetical protein